MINQDKDLIKPKYYTFPISFTSVKEREEFKNIVHSLKLKSNLGIGKLALQAIQLLKESKL